MVDIGLPEIAIVFERSLKDCRVLVVTVGHQEKAGIDAGNLTWQRLQMYSDQVSEGFGPYPSRKAPLVACLLSVLEGAEHFPDTCCHSNRGT